jgi:hypothetical protein
LKCPPPKSLEKEKPIKSTIEKDMNILVADPISETRDFTTLSALFPTRFGYENSAEQPLSRLSRDQLEAFLKAEAAKLSSTHFFAPPPEPPKPTPEKDLAAGVLKQAAYDLRRFHGATAGRKRELYLDAYTWITANDFSWPYSFLNVCKLLDLCPEVVRTELLADASLGWLDYWTRRAGRVSRRLRASFVRVFAGCHNPEDAEAAQFA